MTQNDELSRIRLVIEDLLRKLSVDFEEVEAISKNPEQIKFIIKSKDSGLLIGHHGEHLRAINHVARKLAFKDVGQFKFSVDINNYQEDNIQKIKEIALTLSEKVKNSGQSVEMEPMTSYERRIVHTVFSPEDDVITESVGDGENRRIVIKPRK